LEHSLLLVAAAVVVVALIFPTAFQVGLGADAPMRAHPNLWGVVRHPGKGLLAATKTLRMVQFLQVVVVVALVIRERMW
jgi:hypothetical protein